MAESKSRVLVIGASGYLGKHVAKASVRLGHPTFILVRDAAPTDPTKAHLLKSFQDSGAILVEGDLTDYQSLVSALRQVDVVISTVGGAAILDQSKILEAAKEVGTIKRFFPSEFTFEVDRLELEFKVSQQEFGAKINFRREVEKSGIPYTFVSSGGFAGHFAANLAQDATATPPRDKVFIWGDGNTKAILNYEDDIGTFTIKAVDDPRTENKILHIRPKENTLSQNEMVSIWEKKIGKSLDKTMVSKEEMFKLIEESPFPANLIHAIRYSAFVRGDLTSFELGPKDVEATELYPDVKITSISQFLDRFV